MIHNTMVQKSGLKVTDSETVEVLAGDTIKIGDVVYTINTDANTDIGLNVIIDYLFIAKFSPDGSFFIITGDLGVLKVFSVDGYTLSYIQDITATPTYPGAIVNFYDAIFYEQYLILYDGDGGSGIDCYKIEDNNFIHYPLLNLDADYAPLSSNDFGELIVSKRISVDEQTDYAYTCHTAIISNQRLQIMDIILPENNINSYFNSDVNICAISPNNNYMVLCGNFDGKLIYFSCKKHVYGYEYNPISYLYSDSTGTSFNNHPYDCKFSPDNSLFAVATSGGIYIYSVTESGILFKESFFTTERFMTIEFSPDSKYLYAGGLIDGGVRIFSIGNDKTITYVKSLYDSNKYFVKRIALNNFSNLMFVEYVLANPGGVYPDGTRAISDAYIVNGEEFIPAIETVFPVTGADFTMDNDTYIGVAKKAAQKWSEVSICKILKLHFQ